MSEQVSESVNPGQAIYDALSPEARSAVDALPVDMFGGESGKRWAQQFASSIARAHQGGPSSWALRSPDSDKPERYLTFNVGNANLLKAGAFKEFTVRSEAVRDPALADAIRPAVIRTATTSDPQHSRTILDWNRLEELGLARQVLEAHDAEIDDQAMAGWMTSGKPRTNQGWRWHRDDWRVKLAMITGVDIPAPAYLPHDLIGLPMDKKLVPSDSPSSGATRYWKISAGRGSVDWPSFRDGAFMGVSWYDEPVDPSTFPDQRDAFIDRLMTETSVSRPGAESVWMLRNDIAIGDRVLVYTRGEVLDYGTVTGGYRYEAVVSDYRHRRAVAWKHSDPISTDFVPLELQQKLSRQKTLFELSAEEFAAATQQDIRIDSTTQDSDAVSRVLAQEFAVAGLTYTGAQVASFYTALQTKGFVILSGISGTGKSKIAQRFANMLPSIHVATHTSPKPDDSVMKLRRQPYMQRYNRFAIPMRYQDQLPVPAPGGSWDIQVVVNGAEGQGRVLTADGTHNRNTWVHFSGVAAEAFDALEDEHFFVEFITAEDGSLEAVRIDSQSHVEATVPATFRDDPNHLFLPVRPDWRDGKALIGYHNPLIGEHVRTDFLEFVIAATDDCRAGNRNAFFVILDEMNLAHVEYYFADVLSVIESGRDADGWTVEGIRLAVGEEDADLPAVLRLPPNLYIVGTVNMDETTHPFSPKVLDRAFTIELTDVDFSVYPPEPGDGGPALGDGERQALLDAFTGGGRRYPRIDKDEIRRVIDDHPRFRDDLHTLNTSLKRYRMHVGYRVFDEVMQFVHNAGLNGMFAPDEAFDHAVLMKVLPKFNGSRAKLENALFELLHWCHRGGVLSAADRVALEAQIVSLADDRRAFDAIVVAGSDSAGDDWRYPATGRRAALMMQDLYTDGFASFG